MTEMMYHRQRRNGVGLFGLRYEQMRLFEETVAKNAGWYNRQGEKLGFGDLSSSDFRRISNELIDDELFIVMYEHDSFWDFQENFRKLQDSGRSTNGYPWMDSPGIAYVAEYAMYVIASGERFYCGAHHERDAESLGIQFKYLNPKERSRLLATA